MDFVATVTCNKVCMVSSRDSAKDAEGGKPSVSLDPVEEDVVVLGNQGASRGASMWRKNSLSFFKSSDLGA